MSAFWISIFAPNGSISRNSNIVLLAEGMCVRGNAVTAVTLGTSVELADLLCAIVGETMSDVFDSDCGVISNIIGLNSVRADLAGLVVT